MSRVLFTFLLVAIAVPIASLQAEEPVITVPNAALRAERPANVSGQGTPAISGDGTGELVLSGQGTLVLTNSNAISGVTTATTLNVGAPQQVDANVYQLVPMGGPLTLSGNVTGVGLDTYNAVDTYSGVIAGSPQGGNVSLSWGVAGGLYTYGACSPANNYLGYTAQSAAARVR